MAAGNTINQRIALTGVESIIRELQKMGVEGEKAIGMIYGAARIAKAGLSSLGAGANEAKNGLDAAKRAAKETHEAVNLLDGGIVKGILTLNRYSHAFGELREVIATLGPELRELGIIGGTIAGAGAALILFGKGAIEAARDTRELVNQAHALGMTTEQFEGLQYAATKVGVSIESLNRLMDRFVAHQGEALKAQDEFAKGAGLRAAEAEDHHARLETALRHQDDAEAKANRTISESALGMNRAAIEANKLALAHNKAAYETMKAKDAQDKLNASGGNTNETRLEATIKAQESIVAQQDAAANAIDKRTSAQNKLTDAQIAARHAEDERTQITREMRLADLRAADAAEKQKDEFTRLGISLRDANGEVRSSKDVFADYSNAINKLAPPEQARSLMHEFGRGWQEIMPLIHLGSEGLEKLDAEWVKMGIGATEAEKAMAQTLNESYGKVTMVLGGMKTAVFNILGQIFVPLYDGISDFFATNQATIREFTSAIAKELLPVIQVLIDTLRVAGNGVIAIFHPIHAFFQEIAVDINKVFGTSLTGADLIVGLVSVRFLLTTIIPLVAGWMGTVGELILKAIKLKETFSLIAGLVLLNPFVALLAVVALAVAAAVTYYDAWKPVLDFMEEGFNNLIGTVGSFVAWVQRGIKDFKDLLGLGDPRDAEAAKKLADMEKSSSAPDSRDTEAASKLASMPGHADGGPVGGSGSGDVVPARLEPGEYVVKKSAVQKFGIAFMDALNNGGQGFALGGLVDSLRSIAPQPLRMASGGLVSPAGSPGRSFTLNIEGHSFDGLTAPAKTADNMIQFATTSSILSAGKAPSWKGQG